MYLTRLLQLMAEREASDLFISAGAPIHMKINNESLPVSTQVIDAPTAKKIAYEVMSEEEIARFERDHEMNLSHIEPEYGNFRINVLRQRGAVSMVVRYIRSRIPAFETLKLPAILLELAMERRGLILVVGSTGSGKSTTLASMIDHRNSGSTGHILTVEDPIEYLIRHKRCVVNQREIGHDTLSYENALANALREAPDMLLIGEIRTRETMQHALTHALTGNLCLSTLHATNSYHALSRIVNMYPQEARSGLLADLSYGLKAIIGQRLVRNKAGTLQPAVEVLINTKLVADMIASGDLPKVKEAMEQSLTPGSCTFEQALSKLYLTGSISYDDALVASDSPTNLAWIINQSQQAQQGGARERAGHSANFESFELQPRTAEAVR
ncbi:MAG: PilT/PilU family type 4a pilus ATPase [Betaproteobacteria bacterium]|nr:MAG: PilT/PilU family type 4a pilus ATPase [Betaproteobacteria bacterium]